MASIVSKNESAMIDRFNTPNIKDWYSDFIDVDDIINSLYFEAKDLYGDKLDKQVINKLYDLVSASNAVKMILPSFKIRRGEL